MPETTTPAEYVPLTLSAPGRDGKRRGTMRRDGHEIHVTTLSRESGRYVHVEACSPTHPVFGPVLDQIRVMRKVGPGRYDIGYVQRGNVNDIAERVVNEFATNV